MSLTFDQERHEYRWNGAVVPSVTQVLAPLYDFGGIPRDVLARKASIGTATHLACELIDQGQELDPESIDPAVAPYVDAYRRFLDESKPTVIACEQRVFHPMLRYAGTLDRVYEIDGRRLLVDLKTTAEIHAAVGVQLAGYLGTWQELKPSMERAALQLRNDGTYRLVTFSDQGDWPLFLSLLNLHRWKTKHAR